MPLDLDDEIQRLVAEDRKIRAIKLYMDSRGVGLQEAKQYVESLKREPAPATPAEVEAEIRRLLSEGNRLEAIRALRSATGLGLQEAKDAIDALENANAASPAGVYADLLRMLQDRQGMVKPGVSSLAKVDAEVERLLRAGKKIEAVKLYRIASGLGLKEAKDYVDKIARAMGL